jgi:hypothetical protein
MIHHQTAGLLMKRLVISFFIIALVCAYSCSMRRQEATPVFNSYNYSSYLSLIYKDGRVRYDLYKYRITNYQNYIIYEIPVRNYSQHNGEVTSIWYTTRFTMYHKDSSYGKVILNDTLIERFKVDSLLGWAGTKNMQEPLYRITKDNIEVSSKKNFQGYDLVEVYKKKTKLNAFSSDTVVFYYMNENNNIPFSISKKLDEEKKLKLSKIDFIFNEAEDKENGNLIPPRKDYVLLEKTVCTDSLIIKRLIEKYFKE